MCFMLRAHLDWNWPHVIPSHTGPGAALLASPARDEGLSTGTVSPQERSVVLSSAVILKITTVFQFRAGGSGYTLLE